MYAGELCICDKGGEVLGRRIGADGGNRTSMECAAIHYAIGIGCGCCWPIPTIIMQGRMSCGPSHVTCFGSHGPVVRLPNVIFYFATSRPRASNRRSALGYRL